MLCLLLIKQSLYFIKFMSSEFSASRAKIYTVNSLSKIRGQVKNSAYPQPEGTLGEHMIKHGKDLGEEMEYGECK